MEGTACKKQKIGDSKMAAKIKIASHSARSAQVFQTVLVDIIFRFLNDRERVALREASKFLRIRSNLPQSWPQERYFCPSPEAKQPIAHLVSQMALTKAAVCGGDVGTGPYDPDISTKVKSAGMFRITSGCDYKTIFANSTHTLKHLELLKLVPLVEQMSSMSTWAPQLTSLVVMGQQLMNALANGFRKSGPPPLLTSLTLDGRLGADVLHTILQSVPNLTTFVSRVFIRGLPTTEGKEIRKDIAQLIANMRLVRLEWDGSFTLLQLSKHKDATIHSTLESIDCKTTSMRLLLPFLLKCKNIKSVACRVGTFSSERRNETIAQLPKLESISLYRFTNADDDFGMCESLASIPSIEEIHLHHFTTIEWEEMITARGADRIDDGIYKGVRMRVISGGPNKPLTVYDLNDR